MTDSPLDLLLGRLWEDYHGSFQFKQTVPTWRVRLNLRWRRTRLWRLLNPYYVARQEWTEHVQDELLELLDRMSREGVCTCTHRSPERVTCPWHGEDTYAWKRRREERNQWMQRLTRPA